MSTIISESDILNEMVSPDVRDFPPEAAQALLSLRFTATAVDRMNELAEKIVSMPFPLTRRRKWTSLCASAIC
jgi:hypothetical protein